jgi:predicted permease
MRLLSEVREWLRALFFRRREDRALDEELAFHLEMEERSNIGRGMDPAEARRRAALKLGGVTQVREAARDARGLRNLDDLVRDVRFAVRRLVREPGFSVPTIATIALGIGIATAVFTLVNAVLLRPLPYPDADRLVQVTHVAPGAELAVTGLSVGIYLHYRAHSRTFEDIATWMEHSRTLTDVDAPEHVQVAMVTPSLFAVLGATPHIGRFPTAADFEFGSSNGVLISHDLWVRRYGADPAIVGRTIEIDRRRDVVVGVAQRGFHFPDPETQMWLGWSPEEMLAGFGGPRASVDGLYMNGVARLKRNASPDDIEHDLDRMVRTLPDAYPDVTAEQLERMRFRAVVTPLKHAVVGDMRAALLLLLGTAGFLLLITWANATNLSLVRAERQRREVAVERALGASELRLARRFLSESIVIAVIGGALGLALAYVAVDVRFGFEPGQIPRLREVAIDRASLGLACAIAIVTGVLLAAVSLQSARRAGAGSTLMGSFGRATAGRAEQGTRRLLVAAQVALACMLLTGSALMARSYWQLQQIELGFEPEAALTFFLPLPGSDYAGYLASARLHQDVLGRIRTLPGVDAAEAASVAAFPLTPVPDWARDRVSVAGRPATDSASAPYALFSLATPGYFRAMDIPLLQGRAFQDSDATRERPPVIVSATLARALFGDTEPLGRQVRFASSAELSYTIVGVAGDVAGEVIDGGPSLVVYFPNVYPARPDIADDAMPAFSPRDEQYVVRTSLPPASLIAAVRRSVREVDPKLVMMRVETLDELVAGSMARPRLTMLLLAAGSATALLLGVIGIYGVLAYTVRQRTSELGVRIALGATPEGMVHMVLRQGALLALGGIAAGLAGALALTRFLRSLLYDVSPSDPFAFAAVAVLLFAVALAASYIPARRAGRIDPVRALKME